MIVPELLILQFLHLTFQVGGFLLFHKTVAIQLMKQFAFLLVPQTLIHRIVRLHLFRD